MPASYMIDVARRLVTSRIWGEVTDQELREQHASLRADPDFDATYCQLIDVREMSTVRLSSGVLSSLAQRSNFAPESRRAVIATEDDAFGLARMFSSWAAASGRQVRVFRDLASAEEWLGV